MIYVCTDVFDGMEVTADEEKAPMLSSKDIVTVTQAPLASPIYSVRQDYEVRWKNRYSDSIMIVLFSKRPISNEASWPKDDSHEEGGGGVCVKSKNSDAVELLYFELVFTLFADSGFRCSSALCLSCFWFNIHHILHCGITREYRTIEKFQFLFLLWDKVSRMEKNIPMYYIYISSSGYL